MAADISAATTEIEGDEPDGKSTLDSPGADSAPAVKDPDEAKNRQPNGASDRIDELTRHRREAERDRDYWREMAMKGQPQPEREPQRERDKSDDSDLKTLADFNYDERAYGKYVREVATEAARRETQTLREEFRKSQTQAEREDSRADFQGRAEAWAKEQKLENPELMFADPRDGGPIVTEPMADVILDSEHGPALLHYLAKNRSVATRIARLPPLQAAREIGRLEAKLSERPQTNKVSEAPPPAPQISGASDTAVRKEPEKMSDAEWFADKQRRQRRKS